MLVCFSIACTYQMHIDLFARGRDKRVVSRVGHGSHSITITRTIITITIIITILTIIIAIITIITIITISTNPHVLPSFPAIRVEPRLWKPGFRERGAFTKPQETRTTQAWLPRHGNRANTLCAPLKTACTENLGLRHPGSMCHRTLF